MEWCSSYRSIKQGVKKLDTSVNNHQLDKLCSIGDNAREKLVSYYVDSSTREKMERYGLDKEK